MSRLESFGLVSMLFVAWFTYRQAFSQDANAEGGQSRRMSLVEAWTNIVIGFSINFAANLWVIPMMTGHPLDASANFWGGWIYTTISIVRQYAIRRFFNSYIQGFILWIGRSRSNPQLPQ